MLLTALDDSSDDLSSGVAALAPLGQLLLLDDRVEERLDEASRVRLLADVHDAVGDHGQGPRLRLLHLSVGADRDQVVLR